MKKFDIRHKFVCLLLLFSISCSKSSNDNTRKDQSLIKTNKSNQININSESLGAVPGEEEWIIVPANAGGMGLDSFAVMKFEAKAFTNLNTNPLIDNEEIDVDGVNIDKELATPVSVAQGMPWREIDAFDSTIECESLGENYHLISNAESIAIAREIELQPDNWSDGDIGQGCLFRGNSGETVCGYDSQLDPDSGENRNSRAKHILSNGSEIYDLSGNVWEWVDWEKDLAGYQLAPDTSNCGFSELSEIDCSEIADYEINTYNGKYSRDQGVGYFYGGSGRGVIRGGRWVDQINSGVFSVGLVYAPTAASAGIGFRCVYRP
jgi:hypothetical protein